MPLDDIEWSNTPCKHSGETTMGTYRLTGAMLPGITFGIQQSLADFHPDIDAIHRLTRRPLTFSFDSTTPFSALYGADGMYSPYNAQATLHHYSAFWGMLLPVSVHGRVSDIW
jgi:hypothetical protein